MSEIGAAASKRRLVRNGLRMVAATLDDWCHAVVELTTATLAGCSGPALIPAHSLARPYDAISVAHSLTSLGMMLLRPELPDVADTQYRPAKRSSPRRLPR